MPIIADMLRSDVLAIRQAGSMALKEIAEKQLLNIQRRLDRGISSTGRPFVPYARSTARSKRRFAPVTLFERGVMRGAMYVRRRRLDRFEITFRDRQSERIARWQHGGTRRRTPRDQRAHRRALGTRIIVRNTGPYHVPPRPFIEATEMEVREANEQMEIVISNAFPRDLRRRILIGVTI